MICHRCGDANPHTNRYCKACGASLERVAEQPLAPDPSAQPAARFARDAMLAWVLPVPFLLPIPLFWRHKQVSVRLRGAVALAAALWALALLLAFLQRSPTETVLVGSAERTIHANLERIADALERYRAEHGAYPKHFADLAAEGFLDLPPEGFDEPESEASERFFPIGRIWPNARPVGGSRSIYYRPEFDPTWSPAAKKGEWLVVCDLVFGPGEPGEDAWETGAPTFGPHILLVRAGGEVERVSQRVMPQ